MYKGIIVTWCGNIMVMSNTKNNTPLPRKRSLAKLKPTKEQEITLPAIFRQLIHKELSKNRPVGISVKMVK
jgi:hypothetical protein